MTDDDRGGNRQRPGPYRSRAPAQPPGCRAVGRRMATRLAARALAQEPVALLLDEPTAHLDLNYQIEILELVTSLARDQGLAVVMSLHDINQAAIWADRIALLAQGRLLASGAPWRRPDFQPARRGLPVSGHCRTPPCLGHADGPASSSGFTGMAASASIGREKTSGGTGDAAP